MLRGDLYNPFFENNDWGFEILSGDFQGVVVQIENLKFPREDDPQIDIDFHVIHKPELLSNDDIKGPMFNAVFETIVNDIVREAIEIHNENRNNNT